MVTSLLSLSMNKPARRDIAMTGEVSLTGKVLWKLSSLLMLSRGCRYFLWGGSRRKPLQLAGQESPAWYFPWPTSEISTSFPTT